VRTIGYFAGLALAVLAIPFLTRHLGVDDFGRFVVVGSLIAVAMILADAGLTAVGTREYAVRDREGRSTLMPSLVTARLVAVGVAGAGAAVFTVLAGYESTIVVGTALGAVALVFTMTQQTYTIPLIAELRLELVTALDLLRQALVVGGTLLLVVAGAGLLGFFVLPIPVAIAVLVSTLIAVGKKGRSNPTLESGEWRYLLGETLPAAAASVLASLFYRVAIVVMSLIATAQETGYFGLSFRVAEVFIAVPSLIVGSALPVLARMAESDPVRLVTAFRRLFDISVILGAWTALVLVVGAGPTIALLGGSEFDPAVPVLRIQGVAIAVTFLVAVFSGTLWVVRAKRALVLGHLVGVIAALVLTLVLVPKSEAQGAAVAMLCAEGLLAAWLGVALLRRRPELRPSPRTLAKVFTALVVAAAVAFLPVSDVVAVILGSAAYIAVLLALRIVPAGVWREAILGERAN
jgi:O-antigen/teichoic acid export membrane protein